jgi:hypothetical protein
MSKTKIVFECPSFTVEPQGDGSTSIHCPHFRFDSTQEDGGHARVELDGLTMSFQSSKSGKASAYRRASLSEFETQFTALLPLLQAVAMQQFVVKKHPEAPAPAPAPPSDEVPSGRSADPRFEPPF